MAETFKLRVNGRDCEVQAEPNTPLLYILRNDLKLKGARFGCGEAQCGACYVLFDGHPVASCDTPLWSVPGHEITTIEGLGGPDAGGLHPIQQALSTGRPSNAGTASTASSSPPPHCPPA